MSKDHTVGLGMEKIANQEVEITEISDQLIC